MNMKKIIKINGMHCSSCATSIETILKMKGIKAKVDYDSKKATIEGKISLKEIKKEIENLGYKVSLKR